MIFVALLRLMFLNVRNYTQPGLTPRLGGRLGFLEARRNDINRINAFTIEPTRVSGFVEMQFAPGSSTQEATLDVTFPVWFVDLPGMSFGSSLKRPIIEAGNYPTISVVVVDWVKAYDDRPEGGYYTGAQLAVVASGRTDETMIIHWQAEANGMRIPVGPPA